MQTDRQTDTGSQNIYGVSIASHGSLNVFCTFRVAFSCTVISGPSYLYSTSTCFSLSTVHCVDEHHSLSRTGPTRSIGVGYSEREMLSAEVDSTECDEAYHVITALSLNRTHRLPVHWRLLQN